MDTGFDGLSTLLGGEHGTGRGLLDVAQDRPHLRGRLLRLLGEGFHLLGHDGEAPAFVAGLGGFDGGIDGEQLGLRGEVVHAGDDFADGLALRAEAEDALGDRAHLVADAVHALDGLVDGVPPALCHLGGVLRLVGDGLGALAGELGGLAHLLDGGGGLAHGAGGVIGARGELPRGGHDLAGRGGEHAGRGAHLAGLVAEGFIGELERAGALFDVAEHLVEGVGQRAEFVGPELYRPRFVVACLGDFFGRVGEGENRPRDRALEGGGEEEGEQERAEEDEPGETREILELGREFIEIGPEVEGAEAVAIEHDGMHDDEAAGSEPRAVGLGALRHLGLLPAPRVGRQRRTLGIVKARSLDSSVGAQRLEVVTGIVGILEGQRRGAVPRQGVGEHLEIARHAIAKAGAFIDEKGGAGGEQGEEGGAHDGKRHFPADRQISKVGHGGG